MLNGCHDACFWHSPGAKTGFSVLRYMRRPRGLCVTMAIKPGCGGCGALDFGFDSEDLVDHNYEYWNSNSNSRRREWTDANKQTEAGKRRRKKISTTAVEETDSLWVESKSGNAGQ